MNRHYTSDTLMKNAMRTNGTAGKVVQAFLWDPCRSLAAQETHLVGKPRLPGALWGQTNGFAFSEMHFQFIIANVTSLLLFYVYPNSTQLLFARTFLVFSAVRKRRAVGALLLLTL